MLQLRPSCECCDKDLPPDSKEAMICSFECTYCEHCAIKVLKGICPNCGGEFVKRPVRPSVNAPGNYTLKTHPASTERIFKPNGCVNS